jgi:hypothetical protein
MAGGWRPTTGLEGTGGEVEAGDGNTIVMKYRERADNNYLLVGQILGSS